MPLPNATAPARMALRQDHAHDAHAEVHAMFLDIVLLRTFVAVVEANGFTRAAGFVNLTQSAVSLHIKRLEEQVGRRLFDRTAPKLALTSDGEILLSYAQRILALEEEVKTRLGHPEPEGLVRFGALDVIIDYFHIAAALRCTSGNPTAQTSGRARRRARFGS